MKIKTIKSGKIKENCYIVHDASNSGFIIDPGENYHEIVNYINKNNILMAAIINTHAHYDHIGSVKYLQNKLNIPFYLHSLDEKTLKSANLLRIIFEGKLSIPIPQVDIYIDRLENTFFIGDIFVKVLHTPGHTPGSICLVIEIYIFTWDTLMKGLFGRTDLPGGNMKHLLSSLEKLLNLPGNSVIYPGHGPKSLLNNEREGIKKYLKNQ